MRRALAHPNHCSYHPACDVKNYQRRLTVIQDKYILLSFENIIKLTHKKDETTH